MTAPMSEPMIIPSPEQPGAVKVPGTFIPPPRRATTMAEFGGAEPAQALAAQALAAQALAAQAPAAQAPAAQAPAQPNPQTSPKPSARLLRRDSGVSILEFVGFLPILLLIGLATIQLGLVGYAASQAGSGARAAARVAAQGGSGEAAGQAAMDGHLTAQVGASRGADTTTATVRVHVPTLVPFLDADWWVTRRATMPTDD
jgi:hypothetical protein